MLHQCGILTNAFVVIEKFSYFQTLELNIRLIISIRSAPSLSSLFLSWSDMAEIAGAARKKKFDNHRFNFQRARVCDSDGTNCWRRKKKTKKNWSSLSLSLLHWEHARDRGRTTRARSRWRRHGLKWRVKWPLLPRAKYSKSPILSLFCLSYLHIPFWFTLKMLAARHIAWETNIIIEKIKNRIIDASLRMRCLQ